MRTLSWKHHLGSVTLDVELEDRTISNVTVSPLHAAIILHFQDKSQTFHLNVLPTDTFCAFHTRNDRDSNMTKSFFIMRHDN